jgi:hypothetical protein
MMHSFICNYKEQRMYLQYALLAPKSFVLLSLHPENLRLWDG